MGDFLMHHVPYLVIGRLEKRYMKNLFKMFLIQWALNLLDELKKGNRLCIACASVNHSNHYTRMFVCLMRDSV